MNSEIDSVNQQPEIWGVVGPQGKSSLALYFLLLAPRFSLATRDKGIKFLIKLLNTLKMTDYGF